MATISLYRHGFDEEVFRNAESISVNNGVLVFYYVNDIGQRRTKITTTVPYVIQEDVG